MTRPLEDQAAGLFDLAVAAPSVLAGRRLVISPLVGEFHMYLFGPRMGAADIIVGPLTHWYITHDFKLPMVSRCSRGMRELERDRRRNR